MAKDEEDTEEQEDSDSSDSDDFESDSSDLVDESFPESVESDISPRFFSPGSLSLEADEAPLSQEPVKRLEDAFPGPIKDEEKSPEEEPVNPYEGVETKLYEQNEEREKRDVERAVAVRTADFSPDIETINLGRTRREDIRMIHTEEWGGGGSGDKVYTFREDKDENQKPWETGGDDRMKKYKPKR